MLIVASFNTTDDTLKPLSELQLTRLRVNWDSLTELIDINGGLLATMYSVYSITQRQRNSITTVDKLLEVMQRKSVAAFNKFIDCLGQTGQNHVANILLTENAGMSLQ